ncbi:MAG: AAA family ATPase [bacterium]
MPRRELPRDVGVYTMGNWDLHPFQITMYKNVVDSGRIEVDPLTAIVGKNESGKTTLLRALHKLNPYNPDPYTMDREWPRGRRRQRDPKQVVARAWFDLAPEETDALDEIAGNPVGIKEVLVSRDYAGDLRLEAGVEPFPEAFHPADLDKVAATLPAPAAACGETFVRLAEECLAETKRIIGDGRLSALPAARTDHQTKLNAAVAQQQPPQGQQQAFVSAYISKLSEAEAALRGTPSIKRKAHEYIVGRLPTFIYMDDYRRFQGRAILKQVKERRDKKSLAPEDETLLMIFRLSGLDLNEEVVKGDAPDREQRQYDMNDASLSLTNLIRDRWRQRRYQVQLRADGQHFFTMVEDDTGVGLIPLEERSKGFQWFFSFDLLFMHESQGTFSGCVLLLDEPGLHLHPEAQRDLLDRMEAYAHGNTLIYTTHLPFLLDLRKPERIRIITDTTDGVRVEDDLGLTRPDGRLTLEAALGMSARTSYLVSRRNLVVEGVHDYWMVTEFSNLFARTGGNPLPEDLHITPAGGASEAAYIATFMIGQDLEVAVLLDSDDEGEKAAAQLVRKWLSRYRERHIDIKMVADAMGVPGKRCCIEELFPDEYYLEVVEEVYKKQLAAGGVGSLKLVGDKPIAKRLETAFIAQGLQFNKGSVARVLRRRIRAMTRVEGLPDECVRRARELISTLGSAVPRSRRAAEQGDEADRPSDPPRKKVRVK